MINNSDPLIALIPDPLIPDPLIPDPLIPDPLIPDPLIPDPLIPPMRHTITIRLTAVFGLVLACLAVGTVLAGSPDKSIIEEEDIWAYKKFIRSYEAIHAIRKQGSLLPEVESALSSGIEMTIVLLDRSTSAASAKALAYMNLLKLDGAASKDQTCAVLRKGKSIIPYLEQAKAARTSGRCVMQEVNIKPDQVFCADPEDALRRIENQISTIRSGETCKQ